MITRFKDIIIPWLFVKQHPELEVDLKFVIFLLEDAIINVKSFLDCILPEITLPAGDVVVSANLGVADERWIPVFIYAPLS